MMSSDLVIYFGCFYLYSFFFVSASNGCGFVWKSIRFLLSTFSITIWSTDDIQNSSNVNIRGIGITVGYQIDPNEWSPSWCEMVIISAVKDANRASNYTKLSSLMHIAVWIMYRFSCTENDLNGNYRYGTWVYFVVLSKRLYNVTRVYFFNI